ncbi:hypothetical protein CONLIGDRAFT_686735 [Coniochaeta ligniaria NRRL 30616]|uniref:Uncharacterized protein n=1 Tax=Coniochaeta ligniaria NRRL 30616 TaxID=1408157 RepID=A0A1J7IQA9_9PEZI|nr:hypothetical protein CONLIGDRAFT_686735 [Coniochaeta ligniaria NRRL 30616]
MLQQEPEKGKNKSRIKKSVDNNEPDELTEQNDYCCRRSHWRNLARLEEEEEYAEKRRRTARHYFAPPQLFRTLVFGSGARKRRKLWRGNYQELDYESLEELFIFPRGRPARTGRQWTALTTRPEPPPTPEGTTIPARYKHYRKKAACHLVHYLQCIPNHISRPRNTLADRYLRISVCFATLPGGLSHYASVIVQVFDQFLPFAVEVASPTPSTPTSC